MIPWEQLGTASIPGAEGELRLMRRGAEYSIMTGGIELMNSRMSGSEKALADLTCTALAQLPSPSVLIGGLGMGFTLRAALAVLPADASVTVAELVPAVADWARGPMAAIFEGCLDDPRTDLQISDVGALIGAGEGAYDAILLDVDNGPGALDRPQNDGLYSMSGLAAARRALKDGGVLAVWSAMPDAAFAKRLSNAGFTVDEQRVHAHRKGKGARHVIWLASAA
jgi:spermidine synthase